jgi:alpha-L-fucosidase
MLAQTPAMDGVRPSAKTIEAWKQRRFGMFIHFGLYSMLGGEYRGRRITEGYSEQIRAFARIPRDEYAALAREFRPDQWDADAIARLAREAGMSYIVLTSKHHDGFNLFHTRETRFNAVEASPFGRDLVKELAEACRRNGLLFGVYYSTIDWHDERATPPDVPGNDNPIPPAHAEFNIRQIRELMSNYGPLTEIWFDMGHPTPAQSRAFAGAVHAVQPECLVSGRVFQFQGDFTVMGDNEIAPYVIDEPWQTPGSIYDETWGYRAWQERGDPRAKTSEHILRLAQVVSRGGNYLLNIGPRGDGSVVPFEAEVLRGVGQWLKTNMEATRETQPQPFRSLEFGYATWKPGKLYLLVRRRPTANRLELPGLRNPIRRAFLLDGGRELRVDGAAIDYSNAPDPAPVSVVVCEFDGPLRIVPELHATARGGRLTLDSARADRFYNYNGDGYYSRPTIYKYQWHFAAPAGRWRLMLPGGVQAVVDGKPLAGDTAEWTEAEYHTLAVVPAGAWKKGDALPAFDSLGLRRE